MESLGSMPVWSGRVDRGGYGAVPLGGGVDVGGRRCGALFAVPQIPTLQQAVRYGLGANALGGIVESNLAKVPCGGL